jgi:predicted nucleotide-binding protein
VLSLAHQEAERTRRNSICTEHILIGLMLEEGGVAGRVLRELGLSTDRVREVVQRLTAASDDFDPSHVELASETQQVLEFSIDEARRLGHHYIGTEHILLSLVLANSTGLEVLRRLGVTAEQIRRQTRRVLNETAAAPQNISVGTPPIPQRIHQVLILHGRKEQKKTIAAFIQALMLEPVLIDNHPEIELGLELLDRFSTGVDLAILVLANDPKIEKTESRMPEHMNQNIVYELGYFRGKLGRKHVCVLYLDNFREEVAALSAFTGVVFIPLDTDGVWMTQLAKAIQEVLRPSS